MLAVALGDKETSLSLLAKAVEDREPELIWAKADPRLDVTRGTPGSSPSSTEYFQALKPDRFAFAANANRSWDDHGCNLISCS